MVASLETSSSHLGVVVRFLAGHTMLRIFSVAYLVLAMLSFTCFTAEGSSLSFVSYPLALCGLTIVVSRLLLGRYRPLGLRGGALVGFSVSFVVSAFFALGFGWFENLQGFIWLVLEFFVLCLGAPYEQPGDAHKDLLFFIKVFVLITFAYSVVSLMMALVGFGYGGSFASSLPNTGGLYQSRLYGLYSDPNYGAVCGVVSLFARFVRMAGCDATVDEGCAESECVHAARIHFSFGVSDGAVFWMRRIICPGVSFGL